MNFSTERRPFYRIPLLLKSISELLEDAVEEMSEDLALPIAIVLIVGFLGNKFFQTDHCFYAYLFY